MPPMLSFLSVQELFQNITSLLKPLPHHQPDFKGQMEAIKPSPNPTLPVYLYPHTLHPFPNISENIASLPSSCK